MTMKFASEYSSVLASRLAALQQTPSNKTDPPPPEDAVCADCPQVQFCRINRQLGGEGYCNKWRNNT